MISEKITTITANPSLSYDEKMDALDKLLKEAEANPEICMSEYSEIASEINMVKASLSIQDDKGETEDTL